MQTLQHIETLHCEVKVTENNADTSTSTNNKQILLFKLSDLNFP